MKKMRKPTVAVCVIALLALAGCGRGQAPGAAPDSTRTPPSTGLAESGPNIHEWAPAPSLAAFVKASDAAVVGEVTGVGPARWNTPDAKPDKIDPRQPGKPMPWQFRDATLRVDEVIYDSDAVAVAAGQTIVVRLMGDGSDTGDEVEGAKPVTRINAVSGPVSAGDRVLWVLAQTEFKYTDGRPEPALRLLTDFYGAWRINASLIAESLEPRRSAPLAALVAKLRFERATPTKIPDTPYFRGKVNPLE